MQHVQRSQIKPKYYTKVMWPVDLSYISVALSPIKYMYEAYCKAVGE
jgi:hypothetical protein